jgi:Ca-activated chloride channel family protein
MGIARIFGSTLAALLLASISLATDRVEIIIDNSAAMWGAAGRDIPRVVALREAMTAFAVAANELDEVLEIGVRTVGGHRQMTEDGVCDDTELLLPIDEVDPTTWREALADLFPLGGRPLLQAVKAAVEDLSSGSGQGRIVIVTTGGDSCLGDVATFMSGFAENREAIEFRVVGLLMDRETADALTAVARTRNVMNVSTLLNTPPGRQTADAVSADLPRRVTHKRR